MNLIAECLAGYRFRYASERDLQSGILEALQAADLNVDPEVSLTPGDRIDFLVGDVGVEVKVTGSVEAVTRQLIRYAKSDRVSALVLVTTKARHRAVPRSLCGKPVDVVSVSGVA